MNPYLTFALVSLLTNGAFAMNMIVLKEPDTIMKTRIFQIQGSAMWCFNAYRADPNATDTEGRDRWLHDNPEFDGKCIELLNESINFYHLPKGNPTKLVTMLQAVPTSLNVNGTVHEFVGS